MLNNHVESKLNCDIARMLAVCSYLFFIGWLLAIVLYGRHHDALVRFHLRQSLGLLITFSLLSFVPLVGWALNLIVIALWLLALFYACTGQKHAIPLLGDYFQQQFNFIH